MNKTAWFKVVVWMSLALVGSTPALAEARDCDANAIVNCGAYTASELIDKINRGDGRHSSAELRQAIYGSGFGITEQALQSPQVVDGEVTKDGRVLVSGQVVATGARTMGRQYMAGSTRRGSYWERPPSVSFRSDSLPALVYREGDQFKWAIIKSCGNPVTAKPVSPVVIKTTPPPAPLPETGPGAAGILGTGALGYSLRSYVRSRRGLLAALLGKN